MGRKLSVGNLVKNVDSPELRDLFSAFGTVESAHLVKDVKTGESLGEATVVMGSGREARAAAEALNGTVQFGQQITVTEISAETNHPGFSGAHRGNGSQAGRGNRRSFAGGRPGGKLHGGDR